MSEKLKSFIENDRYFFLGILLLVSIISFGLGRVSALEESVLQMNNTKNEPVRLVEYGNGRDDNLTISAEEATFQSLVASRSGTRYYRQNCSGVARIAEENKIYFIDEERARAAGYTRAVQCFD